MLKYSFTNVGFFDKHETENMIGNILFEASPDDSGQIFFDKSSWLPLSLCCAVNTKKYIAQFPRILSFPEEELHQL